MRIKLLATLALLLMAVSGAWAQDNGFWLDNISGTSATLKYSHQEPGYPYFDGTWHPNGYFDDDQFKAFKEVTCQTITVDASCQNFEGTSLANLFEGWSGLTTINNLGNLKTSEITNMSNMFKGCSALTTLDLSGWNTFKVTDMSNMFYGCTNLTTIYMGFLWNTASSANNMFYNCTKLPNFKSSEVNGTHATTDPGGYLSVKVIWDNTNIFKSTNADNYVNGSHRSQTFEGVTISTNVSSISSLIPYNSEGKASLEVYGYSGDSFTFTTPEGMNFSKIEITGNDDISFTPYVDWTKPENTKIVWSGTAESTVTLGGNDNTTCHNLKSIVLTLQPFPANYYLYIVVDPTDNTKATLKYGEPGSGNPYYQGNQSDPWNSNGYSGDFLDFKGNVCKTITVDATTCKNFNGGTLVSLFDGWKNLTTINGLKNLNTSNVHYMDYMFRYCWYLTTLDLSGWNTSNVETMTEMFKDCNNLTTLNLSGWNTSNVETMTEMFFKCYHLATLTFGNGWDTSNVTDMSDMFRECRMNLTTLDLSGWNTSKVGKMSEMFYHCHNLTTLDLSGWNTSKVTNMGDMFSGCTKLETIYVGDNWKTDEVTSSSNMFNNCTKLPNWESTNPTDKTHAHTGADGYLTTTASTAVTLAEGEDITALSAYAEQTVVVTLTRTFPAGKMQTVCLPFDPSKLLTLGTVWAFTGISDGKAVMTQQTGPLAANTPYIFEATNEVTSITFSGVKVNISNNPETKDATAGFTFHGTYVKKHWDADDDDVKSGRIYGFLMEDSEDDPTRKKGMFVKAKYNTNVRPFSCYLEYNGDLTGTETASTARRKASAEELPDVIEIEWKSAAEAPGETTGIDELRIKNLELRDDAWYSLDGRRLSGKPSVNGLYIHNGKLVIKN